MGTTSLPSQAASPPTGEQHSHSLHCRVCSKFFILLQLPPPFFLSHVLFQRWKLSPDTLMQKSTSAPSFHLPLGKTPCGSGLRSAPNLYSSCQLFLLWQSSNSPIPTQSRLLLSLYPAPHLTLHLSFFNINFNFIHHLFLEKFTFERLPISY